MKVPCLLDQPDTSRRRDCAGNVVALDLTGTSREVSRSRQFHDFEHYLPRATEQTCMADVLILQRTVTGLRCTVSGLVMDNLMDSADFENDTLGIVKRKENINDVLKWIDGLFFCFLD